MRATSILAVGTALVLGLSAVLPLALFVEPSASPSSIMSADAPTPDTVSDLKRFYPRYDELTSFMDDLDASPIVDTRDLSELSSDGRILRAIKVSDNPDVEEDDPTFLFVGVTHGYEPLGARVVLQLLENLTEQYGTEPGVTAWVNDFETWIVPVINPYGYDARAGGASESVARYNANAVDLNRNFDFRWERCEETDTGACLK